MKALLLVALLFMSALPVVAQAETYPIDSNTTWIVVPSGQNAQNVCLDADSPSHCPVNATQYGYNFPGWDANLSPIPQAKWIWAPNVTGATSTAINAEVVFKSYFFLCDKPSSHQTIFLAADNFAEVFLNCDPTDPNNQGCTRASVAKIAGSATDTSTHNSLSSFSVDESKLNQGLNTIYIKASNAANNCTTYQCNPAGVVFGGVFKDALPEKPTCPSPPYKDATNRTLYRALEFHDLGCPPDKLGQHLLPCLCNGSIGFWGLPVNTCVTPPPACTDYTFSVWSACGIDGQQTRTVTGYTPAGCAGTLSTQPVLTQACPHVPPTCASFTYSAWGECQPDNTQTRTMLTSSPAGCTGGGTPVTTQSCTYVPPLVGESDKCGDSQITPPIFANCPSGTTCNSRTFGGHKPAWWCIFTFGIGADCESSPPMTTAEMYCDP